jgi:hypothetical protein
VTDLPPDDDELDGCDADMTVEDQLTSDDQVAPLVMFADVFGDDEAVEQRRRELMEWDAALHPGTDDTPTTGAP